MASTSAHGVDLLKRFIKIWRNVAHCGRGIYGRLFADKVLKLIFKQKLFLGFPGNLFPLVQITTSMHRFR